MVNIMARHGISYEDVKRAAESIVSQQENPTVDRVRLAMGGTGSKSTIAPLLKRWRQNVGSAMTEKNSLPDFLLTAVQNLYDEMEATKEQEITQHAETYLAKSLALEQTFASQAQLIADLTNKLEQTTAALQVQTQEHQLKQDQLMHWQLLHTRLEAEHQGSQLRLQDQQTELQQLHKQLTQLSAQFEHYQKATAELRQQERLQADQKQQALEHELQQTRQQNLAIQELYHKQQADLLTHQQTLQQSVAAHEKLEQQLHTERSEMQDLARKTNADLLEAQKIALSFEQQVQQSGQALQLHQHRLAEQDVVIDNLRHQLLDIVQERKAWNKERQDLLEMLARLQQWQMTVITQDKVADKIPGNAE